MYAERKVSFRLVSGAKVITLVVVPWHYLNIEPLILEIETKEDQLRAQGHEYAQALSRLEDLEVSNETKAMFQRFVKGEITIKELDAAIDEYINRKASHGADEG